ncbi:hypothetical protein AAG570_005601, partial [Ranatra chinensis]
HRHGSWRRAPEGRLEDEEGKGVQVGLSRISGIFLDRADDNSDRRTYGTGIFNRIFSRSLKRSVMSREPVREQLEDLEDHRPFFTYWITTVQILILIISLVCYGFGPVGFTIHHQSGLVLVPSLSLQQVEYDEPANFYIGPRAADLIHLGAKFAPCMRRDAKILKEIEKGREKERDTACCIRNDDSGCVQSSKAECSVSTRNHLSRGLSPTNIISTWKKWSLGDSGPGGRISGSVCGLDPKYCEAPASVAPYEWPDDITKWPICRKTASSAVHRPRDKLAAEHMVCEVIGHPCCIGIHATCHITTKEYCDFVHGHFHEEASLCSQVSCLDDVCGMVPFYTPEVPDQFYRLLTSIFLHAGLIHLAITVVVQWFLMRDLEKFVGSFRIMIIYFGSGIGGNLASAIFVPYRADVGPAGSQFGLLACLIVEVMNMWPMLRYPHRALFKLLSVTFALFCIGLLPWVDNFSHLFGFIFGFLLSYALIPFISFGAYDRQKKIFLISVCLITSVFLMLLLVLFFYVIPVYDCEVCGYLNCLPLSRDFCSSQNINFRRPLHSASRAATNTGGGGSAAASSSSSAAVMGSPSSSTATTSTVTRVV